MQPYKGVFFLETLPTHGPKSFPSKTFQFNGDIFWTRTFLLFILNPPSPFTNDVFLRTFICCKQSGNHLWSPMNKHWSIRSFNMCLACVWTFPGRGNWRLGQGVDKLVSQSLTQLTIQYRHSRHSRCPNLWSFPWQFPRVKNKQRGYLRNNENKLFNCPKCRSAKLCDTKGDVLYS